MDWQVGDLAVCVDARPDTLGCRVPLEVGRTYHVVRVTRAPCLNTDFNDRIGLYLAEVECGRWHGWTASRFRKIRPDEHESCEPEFVTLLKRSKAPAKETASAWLLRVGPIAKRLNEQSQEDGRPAQKALPVNK